MSSPETALLPPKLPARKSGTSTASLAPDTSLSSNPAILSPSSSKPESPHKSAPDEEQENKGVSLRENDQSPGTPVATTAVAGTRLSETESTETPRQEQGSTMSTNGTTGALQHGRGDSPAPAPALPPRRPSNAQTSPTKPSPSSSSPVLSTRAAPATPTRIAPSENPSPSLGVLDEAQVSASTGSPVPAITVRKPTLESAADGLPEQPASSGGADREWVESGQTSTGTDATGSSSRSLDSPSHHRGAGAPPLPPRISSRNTRPPAARSEKDEAPISPSMGSALPSLPPQVESLMPAFHWILISALVLNLFLRGALSSFWLSFAVLGYGVVSWLKAQDHRTHTNALRQAEDELKAEPENKAAVDWLNQTLAVLFPLISTDVLTPFMDLLEDAIMEQVPSIITSARLTSATLGAEPVTLTSLQVMSDDEWFRSISSGHEFRRQTKERAAKARTKEERAEVSGTKLGVPNNWDNPINEEPSEAAGDRAKATRERRASESTVGTLEEDNEEVKGETTKMRKRDRVLSRVARREAGSQQAANPKEDHSKLNTGDVLAEAEDREGGVGWDQDDPNSDQYVNYKIGFKYQRSDATAARGRGLHMVGYFGVGLKGVGRTEIPIYMDLQSLRGSCQVRILLSATPPFVRSAIITLPSLPSFDVSAKPLSNTAFNAMGVPGVKTFVQRAVSEVCAAFVRPETYALDIDRLLLGRESSLRTHAIGVLQLVIHGAHGLPKTDMKGSCDPYVVASFSRFNKPLYSTRSIIDSRDPIWEEPAFLLIAAEAISSGETLRLRVVDSDRFSSDDDLGVVELDLADLVDQYTITGSGGKLARRRDNLTADRPGMRAWGSLEWSLAFRPLWQMPTEEVQKRTQKMQDEREPPYIMPGWMAGLSRLIEGYTWEYGWNEERKRRRKETVAWFTGEKERDEMEVKQAPTDELRSGVLQFHIHQCTELELENTDGTYSHAASKRKSAVMGKPALEDVIDRTPTENPHPPSAYCEVHLNDRLIYRTRTKQVTPMPYFNAVSERFIRDWRLAKLVFVIRDERDREHDPILGLVAIPLREAFKDRCQFTRWYPVVGGLGWGKLRISLLFKPLDVDLPRGVSGYEVATMRISGVKATEMVRGMEMCIETEGDKAVLRSKDALDVSGQGSELNRSISRTSIAASGHTTLAIDSAAEDIEWQIERPIRLAVQYRHSCSVLVSFVSRSKHLKKKKVFGLATVRLDDCPDGQEIQRRVPVWGTAVARDAVKATQKFSSLQKGTEAMAFGNPDTSPDTADGLSEPAPGTGLPTEEDERKRQDETDSTPTIIGFLTLTFTLVPGVSAVHASICKRDLRFRNVFEAWELARELNKGWDKVSHGGEMKAQVVGMMNDQEDSDEDHEAPDGGEEESGSSDSEDDDEVTGQGRDTLQGGNTGSTGRTKGAKGGMELDDEWDKAGDRGFWKEKRAHSKALHKRNKGIFQLKIARTGKFVKDKLQEKLYQSGDKSRMIRGTDMEVEREGQSSL